MTHTYDKIRYVGKRIPSKCWYYIYIEECVMCGKTEETRIRRPLPKPKDPRKRIEFKEFACGHHFM